MAVITEIPTATFLYLLDIMSKDEEYKKKNFKCKKKSDYSEYWINRYYMSE